MALSTCKECDGKVSTLAKTCPHCGVPNPAIKKKTSIKNIKPWGSEKEIKTKSSTVSPSKSAKEEETSWGKFMDGNLDLKTAFWGYGFFGSIVVGVVCGFLAEAFSPFFILVYAIAMVVIIIGLWQCASTYKKQMAQKKASELWGILTQGYCVLAALGLANFIKDFL